MVHADGLINLHSTIIFFLMQVLALILMYISTGDCYKTFRSYALTMQRQVMAPLESLESTQKLE